MPLYSYRCTKCAHSWDSTFSIANRKAPESEPCPNCKEENSVESYISGAPSYGDPVRLSFKRPDNGFKETLQRIHEKTPGSTLRDSSILTRL